VDGHVPHDLERADLPVHLAVLLTDQRAGGGMMVMGVSADGGVGDLGPRRFVGTLTTVGNTATGPISTARTFRAAPTTSPGAGRRTVTVTFTKA
jgi:hypothetical protein